ncbi:unnamed protein product [Rodentolepis nana]|uniref:NUC173 domain-containing protein n=1 Tax=Rodentolepis nana TaxID=102285 RepID=A0A0R3TP06_RODNA|nr:unnamed protein product [Rodentolepis nana]
MSTSCETFASWATHITRCSNPTFNSVVDRLWSNPSLQKDVLAVLSGITKTIQDRNGKESGPEYFAILLSLLNTESNTKTAEAYLLQLVVSKAVPASLLRSKCAEATKTITNVLSAALKEDTIDTVLCKSHLKKLLVSLGRILAAQPTDDWASESLRHTYRIFLQFIESENATLRRTSHKMITQLLTFSFGTEVDFHPVCHRTVLHVCKNIRQQYEELTGLIRITDSGCSRLLYNLSLLRSIIGLVSEKDVKMTCEHILELTRLNNSLVVRSTFGCIQMLFQGRYGVSRLSLEIAGKLMTVLLSCKPRDSVAVDAEAQERDSETLIAWLECMSAGVGYLTNLAAENQQIDSTESPPYVAVEHLGHLITAALNIVVSSHLPSLRNSVKRIMVTSIFVHLNEQIRVCDLLTRRPRLLPDLCLTLQNALDLARRETWTSLLNLSSHLLHTWAVNSIIDNSTVDVHLPPEVISLLQHVGNLRDVLVDGAESVVNSTGVNINVLIDELDRVVLSSMESWGIEPVIREALPLEPLVVELESGSVELRRSWMLPLIIRAHPINPCSLAFFHSAIIPLADRSLVVAKAAAAQTFQRKVGSGTKFVPLSAILNAAVQLSRQLWTILTPFTRNPPSRWSDLKDSGIGGRMFAALITSKAIRPVILSALRRLVFFAESEEAIDVMRGGAKQLLPVIFPMFEELGTNKDQSLKQQLEATLNVFLPLLTPKMLTGPCQTAYTKLVTTKNPIYMEILMTIVPNLTSDDIKTMLGKLEEYFTPNDPESRALRKPAYRLLEAILSSPNQHAKNFAVSNLENLIQFMARIAPPITVPNAVAVETPVETDSDPLSTTMAALELSAKERKAYVVTMPWKVRLRILRHLLKLLVQQKQETDVENGTGGQPGETSPAVEEFISIFLPEIPQCLGSLNSVVRVIAGRLLVEMVMASTGGVPPERGDLPVGRSRVSHTAASEVSDMDDDDDEEGGNEDERSFVEEVKDLRDIDDDDDIDDNMSDSGVSRVPTEIASVRTAISTTGMDPAVAEKTCSGLHRILAFLWPVVLNVTPQSISTSSKSELLRIEVTTKCVCRLISDLHLRRCLMTSLQSGREGESPAADIIATAKTASLSLVKLPNKQIARLGLQISRLLIAFVGYSVFVADIVVAIQSVHSTHKHSLRFMVKKMVEKLLKKGSLQALLTLMNSSYHKMIRNSAKILRRAEKKNSGDDKTLPGDQADEDDDDDELASVATSRRAASVSGASHLSAGSALSLSKRIHTANLTEILAPSSDEEEEIRHAEERKKALEAKTKKVEPERRRRQGLAAELERAASVSGLSRRSKRSLLRRGLEGDESSDGDDEDFDDGSELIHLQLFMKLIVVMFLYNLLQLL